MLSPTILDSLLADHEKKEINYDYKAWVDKNDRYNSKRVHFIVSLMHLFGKYRKQDTKLGWEGLLREAKSDITGVEYTEAVTVLGLLYKDGFIGTDNALTVEKNIKLAKILLYFAGRVNDPVAILHSGIMHKKYGKIMPEEKDFKNARKIFGQDVLNRLQSPHDYLKNVREQAFQALTNSAKQRKPYDLFNLALAYEYGIGTDMDKRKACSLYLKAHEAGHELGQPYAHKLLEEYKKTTNSPAKPNNTESKTNTQTKVTAKAASSTSNKQSQVTSQSKKTLHAPQDNKRKRDEMMDTSNSAGKAIKLSTTVSSSNEQTVKVTLRDFKPQMQPDQLDYSAVQFFTKKSKRVKASKGKENTTSNPASSVHTSTELAPETAMFTEQAIKDIGRWGEGCVYHALEQHYRAQYSGHAFIVQNTGFKLLDKRNKKNTIQVIWYNKETEQYKSKDFTVVKTKDGVVTKHRIEVKATTSNTEHTAMITKNEFLKMLKYSKDDSKRYSIFRVYNAGKAERVRIEKIKQPLDKILNKELEVSSLTLNI